MDITANFQASLPPIESFGKRKFAITSVGKKIIFRN
jgi:hypothetical protein|tara:strand:+ start:165 stop:272 length:108 start_codon:yes stop_codon:yes gene_type:complete